MQNSTPASRPRIGIPVRLSSSADPDPRVAKANGLFDDIVDLVRGGGGEPVLLTPELVDDGLFDGGRRAGAPGAIDGVVLPGGGDEPGDTLYDVNPEQDRLDIAVARGTIDAGLPLLGICRGHQLLNVVYGGTLTQDMAPGTVAHRNKPPGGGRWAWHEVAITPGSRVARLYGAATNPALWSADALGVKIASGHHQAVAQVAPGLVVTAVAEDGTVEALEDPKRWVVSVQWHPEVLELSEAQRQAPFRAFVEACRS